MDLLNPKSAGKLKIREHPTKGVWVDGLTEQYTIDVDEVCALHCAAAASWQGEGGRKGGADR